MGKNGSTEFTGWAGAGGVVKQMQVKTVAGTMDLWVRRCNDANGAGKYRTVW